MTINKIEIAKIHLDMGTQMREGLDQSAVDEYASAMIAGDQFPPVRVFNYGDTYWLTDGFHRVAAAKKIGYVMIEADVQLGGLRDAIIDSTSVNAKHGLRRSREATRRSIETLLKDEEWGIKSDSQIAKKVGCDHKTVGARRTELEASGEIPKMETRMVVRNGTSYQMKSAAPTYENNLKPQPGEHRTVTNRGMSKEFELGETVWFQPEGNSMSQYLARRLGRIVRITDDEISFEMIVDMPFHLLEEARTVKREATHLSPVSDTHYVYWYIHAYHDEVIALFPFRDHYITFQVPSQYAAYSTSVHWKGSTDDDHGKAHRFHESYLKHWKKEKVAFKAVALETLPYRMQHLVARAGRARSGDIIKPPETSETSTVSKFSIGDEIVTIHGERGQVLKTKGSSIYVELGNDRSGWQFQDALSLLKFGEWEAGMDVVYSLRDTTYTAKIVGIDPGGHVMTLVKDDGSKARGATQYIALAKPEVVQPIAPAATERPSLQEWAYEGNTVQHMSGKHCLIERTYFTDRWMIRAEIVNPKGDGFCDAPEFEFGPLPQTETELKPGKQMLHFGELVELLEKPNAWQVTVRVVLTGREAKVSVSYLKELSESVENNKQYRLKTNGNNVRVIAVQKDNITAMIYDLVGRETLAGFVHEYTVLISELEPFHAEEITVIQAAPPKAAPIKLQAGMKVLTRTGRPGEILEIAGRHANVKCKSYTHTHLIESLRIVPEQKTTNPLPDWKPLLSDNEMEQLDQSLTNMLNFLGSQSLPDKGDLSDDLERVYQAMHKARNVYYKMRDPATGKVKA